MFSHDFSEKDTQNVDIKKDSDINYEQLMQMLKHIYSDQITIEPKFIYDLLKVSKKLVFHFLFLVR